MNPWPASQLTLALSAEALEALANRVAEILQLWGSEEGPSARFAAERIGVSPFLTVAEAADYLRVKRQRVYDLLSSGRLTRIKEGSRVLISRAEVDAYLGGSAPSAIAPALPHTPANRMGSGL